MIKYIIKRLLLMVLVLFGVAVLIFTIMYFVPGDPTSTILGGTATEAEREYLREQLGLNRPYIVRLGSFLSDLFLHFDFGTSYTTSKAVLPELLNRLPRTAIITVGSIIIAIVIGLPLGINAAIHQNTIFDRISMVIALLGVSVPNFWLALLMIQLFSLYLGWLPAYGYDSVWCYVMPWISSCFGTLAQLSRQSRSSMLEVIRMDYITTAKAKGVSSRDVILKHALPNAMIPVLTVIGSSIAVGLAGSLIIEQVYSIPGLGMYMITAINSRDYAAVQGSVIFIAFIFSIVMLLVDIVYAFVDPRIKAQYESGGKKRRAKNE